MSPDMTRNDSDAEVHTCSNVVSLVERQWQMVRMLETQTKRLLALSISMPVMVGRLLELPCLSRLPKIDTKVKKVLTPE